MKGKKSAPRSKYGKKMYRRRRSVKKFGQSDYARVTHVLQNELEITATGNGTSATPSQSYGLYTFALSNSPRAVQIAAGYQEYRISRVEVIVKPNADTYESAGVSTGASPGVPYLLYMIDKTGTLDNAGTNSLTLKQAGAKPIRMEEKGITIRFRPAVQVGSSDQGSPPGPAPIAELSALYRTSPWITTNANSVTPGGSWAPNSVDHMGIVLSAEQPRGPLGVQVASVSFRLTYEFRKPLWQIPPAPGVVQQKVDLDKLGNGNGADVLVV